MPRRLLTPAFGLLLLLVPPARAGDEADTTAADERALAEAHVRVDGPSLLAFLRKQTPTAALREKLAAAVRELGDHRYRVRRRAAAELVAAGVPAVPFLRDALKDPDPEIARQAGHCLERINRGEARALTAAAARLVGRRRPAGAAAVLLAYAPFADDADVVADVQTALTAVARPGGKPDPVLVQALEGRDAARRAAAGEALIRSGPAPERRRWRKLLRDPDAAVRLRAALAFLDAGDKRAVPVLIALLAELPAEQAAPAEDALYRLAGEDAPPGLDAKGMTPARVRAAWTAWWDRRRDKIDLARARRAPGLLGYKLVVLNGLTGAKGQLVELDRAGKVRWQIDGLDLPRDAQVLPGNRVLVAEEAANRVTVRSLKGRILWEKSVPQPIICERLPGGNTFIATRTKLLVVDRRGKEVLAVTPALQGRTICTALRLPGGRLGVVESDYTTFKWFNAAGKELKSFPVDYFSIIGHIEVVPGHHLLVPESRKHRVAEYDPDGKLCSHVPAANASDAVRLPGGRLLVTSWSDQWLREIDRTGKVLKEQKLSGRPCRARVR